jgi:hypothetical protein
MKVVIALCLGLVGWVQLGGVASAQCPNGQCPRPGYASYAYSQPVVYGYPQVVSYGYPQQYVVNSGCPCGAGCPCTNCQCGVNSQVIYVQQSQPVFQQRGPVRRLLFGRCR